MFIEKQITNYVLYVSKHPLENVNDIANRYFTGNIESFSAQKLVIPELLLLQPSKRSLVVKIIKQKTNCDVASSRDNFKTFLTIKDVGEVMQETLPKFVKKIKWFLK